MPRTTETPSRIAANRKPSTNQVETAIQRIAEFAATLGYCQTDNSLAKHRAKFIAAIERDLNVIRQAA